MKKDFSVFVLFGVIFVLLLNPVYAYEIQYFHTDSLGSPVAITDENASVVWSADYELFGESFNEIGNNSYQYNAKELDDSGLLYYGARYYDADIGRFTTADTIKGKIEQPQSLNLYTYVQNNPLKYVDPSGNEPEKKEIGLLLISLDLSYDREGGFLEGLNDFKEYSRNYLGDSNIPLITIDVVSGRNSLQGTINYFSENDYTIKFLGLSGHGSEWGTITFAGLGNRGNEVPSIELGKMLKKLDFSEDAQISFFSCSFGKCGAQKVADITGIKTHASDRPLYGINPETGRFKHGNLYTLKPLISGEFELYNPFLRNTRYFSPMEGVEYYTGEEWREKLRKEKESSTKINNYPYDDSNDAWNLY